MPRSVNSDADDLLQYIEEGGSRIGKSVAIPSPDGRNMAGWTQLQNLKVQPEVMTMLEQLRQHELFKGHWKTNTQVAWSMIYLGLKACYQFYSDGEHSWDRYRSTFMVYEQANLLHDKQMQQARLRDASRVYRNVFHTYLDKSTANGKYHAWKTLDNMMDSRDLVQDKVEYDRAVIALGPIVIGQEQVFDTRVADYWTRLYPIPGGSLSESNCETIYIELTQDWFDEQEAIRNAEQEES